MRAIALRIYKSLADHSDYSLTRKRTVFVLKAAFSFFILGYIIFKLIGEKISLADYMTYLSGTGLLWILLGMGGMWLNLAFEACKWWLMVRKADRNYKFIEAYKSVFAGLTTGIFTPNRIGEYAGRIVFLQPAIRLKAVAYLFIDRVCQMIVTIFMGTIAFEYFWAFHSEELLTLLPLSALKLEFFRLSLWFLSFASPIALLLIQQFAPFLPGLRKYSFFQKMTAGFEDLSPVTVFQVIGLGTLRYLVFTAQYICLLLAFGYQGTLTLAIAMVLSVFLVKSIIPSITLTELGIRESVAITIMGSFAVSGFIAFSSTFFLYLMNIILPSIIGLIFLNRMKV